jgi:hypothetical protein
MCCCGAAVASYASHRLQLQACYIRTALLLATLAAVQLLQGVAQGKTLLEAADLATQKRVK